MFLFIRCSYMCVYKILHTCTCIIIIVYVHSLRRIFVHVLMHTDFVHKYVLTIDELYINCRLPVNHIGVSKKHQKGIRAV